MPSFLPTPPSLVVFAVLMLAPTLSSSAEVRGEDLCASIAELSNSGKIKKYFDKASPIDAESAYKLLGDEAVEVYQDARVWRRDVDGDGTKDTIVETHGQQVPARLFWRRTGSAHITELEGNANEVDLSFFSFHGHHYVVGYAWREALTKAWSFGEDMSLNQVCSFHQRPAPRVSLQIGGSKPVCKALGDGEGRYFTFTESQPDIVLPPEALFWAKSIEPGTTIADINNDGHSEQIVRLLFLPGNGRQCDSVFFAALDTPGRTVANNSISQALSEMDTCVPVSTPNALRLFTYRGIVYIEAGGWVGDRDVYHLKDGKLETDCRFVGKYINEPDR